MSNRTKWYPFGSRRADAVPIGTASGGARARCGSGRDGAAASGQALGAVVRRPLALRAAARRGAARRLPYAPAATRPESRVPQVCSSALPLAACTPRFTWALTPSLKLLKCDPLHDRRMGPSALVCVPNSANCILIVSVKAGRGIGRVTGSSQPPGMTASGRRALPVASGGFAHD
jgi:hypothetical protein